MRKWQGPLKIKQKLGQVNYEVIIDSEGNTKVYHINLLKKWFSRTETVSSYANTVEEDANMELYKQSDQQTPQINQELSEDQKSQLLKLIQKYPTVTTLIQHKISTNECHTSKAIPITTSIQGSCNKRTRRDGKDWYCERVRK